MIRYLGHRIRAKGVIDFNLNNQYKSFGKIEVNKTHKVYWNETKIPRNAKTVVHNNNVQFKGFSLA